MKTKKITKAIIGVMAGLMLLSMSATAQAVLSGNLLVNGDFSGAAIIDNASGSLESGKWYGSGIGWDLIADGGNIGAYAKLTEENSVQHLIQTVQLPPNSAAQGPVQVSFDYTALGLNTGQISVNLYGSNNNPTYGNYGSYGTLLGTISGTLFSNDQKAWTEISSSGWNASQGYNWYTIDIYTKTQNNNSSDNYFGVDNVSVKVSSVPIPAAVWLLSSGLIGIVAIRRRFSN